MKRLSPADFRDFVNGAHDLDTARIHYCYQIGSTFVNLASMEDTFINAMSTCDRIKVVKLLGEDVTAWDQLKKKRDHLQASTLGSLLTILSKHSVEGPDLAYLRWLKEKRDLFIHRFFHQGQWPGELDADEINIIVRRLLYLEAIFARASHRIWRILSNAGLYVRLDLGENGAFMMNPDLFGPD